MLRLTSSTTSTKASFFLYFTSPLLQFVAPVAWDVIFEEASYTSTYKEAPSQTFEEKELTALSDAVEDTILSVVI
jgi:hypothetical protein